MVRFEYEKGATMKTSACKSPIKYLILLGLFLFAPLCSQAEEAKFADTLISNNAQHILVYTRVTDCFTPGMESAILAGVPTTFTFLFELYQERPYWWDRKIAHLTVQHTVKYDNVKKTFQVDSTNGKEAAAFPTLDTAKRAMAELNGVAVAPLYVMAKGESYYLQMKARLDKVRLPFSMEYLFFFVSLWDFETDWHRQKVAF